MSKNDYSNQALYVMIKGIKESTDKMEKHMERLNGQTEKNTKARIQGQMIIGFVKWILTPSVIVTALKSWGMF